HFGFYYTNDITASQVVWQHYQNNLPNTVLQYLTTDRCATTLGLFSYGSSLYTIQLPGAGGFGTTGTSVGCPAPAPGPTIKVQSVTVTGKRTAGSKTTATAQVTIVDANGAPVSGATVSGNWSGAYTGSGMATTNSSGVAPPLRRRARRGGRMRPTPSRHPASARPA
ncbi:MAG TPA: Ig-like domain-containing protein, partial [Herpetosiphonaceae bacterium]|nr:Ig-like domain-containing protein [Herpetosiphonaceae bacterium]